MKATVTRFILFSILVVTFAGCIEKVVIPAPEPWPSKVVTSDGMAFFVNNLRIPGTMQAVKLREAGTTTWIPLTDIGNIRFKGPVCEQYRPVRIYLLKGGRLEGELFADFLIEGKSDQGYWNMSMTNVETIDFGSD